MIGDVLAAAEQPGLHWRYRCLAECALCMLLPLLDAATATAVTRHWAALLTSDMLLLRQLAAAGLTMLLLPVWHVPHPGALGGGRSLAAAADEQVRQLLSRCSEGLSLWVGSRE
jgi:hypothetical protein